MSTVTLAQAVRNALEAEQAANRFYTLLAESTADGTAQAFLERMAAQEQEHFDGITEFARKLDAGELPTQADWNVETIETQPEAAFLDNLDFAQSLKLALDNEHHAALIYGALAEAADGEAADFFGLLARGEEEHAEVLEKLLAGL